MEYITLTISAQTLNAIGAALQEIPYKLAAPAIKEIDEQVKAFVERQNEPKTGETSARSDNETGG